jgi:hypothetical protein
MFSLDIAGSLSPHRGVHARPRAVRLVAGPRLLRSADGFESLIHVLVFGEPLTPQIAKRPDVAKASVGLDAALPSDASGADDRKVARVVWYPSREEALAAAGLAL